MPEMVQLPKNHINHQKRRCAKQTSPKNLNPSKPQNTKNHHKIQNLHNITKTNKQTIKTCLAKNRLIKKSRNKRNSRVRGAPVGKRGVGGGRRRGIRFPVGATSATRPFTKTFQKEAVSGGQKGCWLLKEKRRGQGRGPKEARGCLSPCCRVGHPGKVGDLYRVGEFASWGRGGRLRGGGSVPEKP